MMMIHENGKCHAVVELEVGLGGGACKFVRTTVDSPADSDCQSLSAWAGVDPGPGPGGVQYVELPDGGSAARSLRRLE
eukprot:1945457-Rhodomonas_salina.1